MANGPTSNVTQITDLFAFVRNNKMVQHRTTMSNNGKYTHKHTLALIERVSKSVRSSKHLSWLTSNIHEGLFISERSNGYSSIEAFVKEIGCSVSRFTIKCSSFRLFFIHGFGRCLYPSVYSPSPPESMAFSNSLSLLVQINYLFDLWFIRTYRLKRQQEACTSSSIDDPKSLFQLFTFTHLQNLNSLQASRNSQIDNSANSFDRGTTMYRPLICNFELLTCVSDWTSMWHVPTFST